MPIGGRPSASGRAPQGRQVELDVDPAIDLDGAAGQLLERLAPDVEHRVGPHQRIAQRGGLLGVQVLRLLAVLGGGEVELARHAQQLVARDGRAGSAAAVGDVGLDRAEVAAAVEDDGQLLAEREPRHPQRDRCGGLRVQEGPPEDLVGALGVVHTVLHPQFLPVGGVGQHRPTDWVDSTAGRVSRPWG
jgi:hypothetical protein